MSNILSNVDFGNPSELGTTKDNIKMDAEGFIIPTNLYKGQIKNIYCRPTDSGALRATIELTLDLGKGETRDYREEFTFTNKDKQLFSEKNGKRYYNKKALLLNSLAIVTLRKSFDKLVSEDKQVEVYNFKSKAKEMTTVAVWVELIGKVGYFAIRHIKDNKKALNGEGKWVPTAEIKEVNEIYSVGNGETKHTASELTLNRNEGKNLPASFLDKWAAEWADVMTDNSKPVKGATQENSVENIDGATSVPKDEDW